MSTLFLDSFDHYATADIGLKYDTAAGTISSTTPRTGINKLALGSGTLTKLITATFASPGMGAAVNITANPGVETNLMRILTTVSGLTWELRVQTDGTLKLYRNSVLQGSVAVAITTGAWFYIEMRVSSVAANAGFHVRINNVTVLGSTFSASTAVADNVLFAVVSVHASHAVDDLYLSEGLAAADGAEFIGDCGVQCRLANAVGGFSQWTPLSSTNFSNVDEAAQDSDTTYVETGTPLLKDSYAFNDFSLTELNSQAFQETLCAKRANATGTISVVCQQGDGVAQNDFGPTHALTAQSTYKFFSSMGTFSSSVVFLNTRQYGMKVV